MAVAVFAMALAADAFYWWRERWDRKELRVTHLNVGQGDAAVVELPRSKVLVIDAGGAALGILTRAKASSVHFCARARFSKWIIYSSVIRASIITAACALSLWNLPRWNSGRGRPKGRTTRFDDLEEALEQTRIKRVTLSDQEPCRAIDGVKLCVLYPPPDGVDDTSVVLRLEFGKVRFLFAGDLDKRDEQRLQSQAGQLRSPVLKVPRHGSAGSSTQEFVTAVRPSLAIFSVGSRNPFGFPVTRWLRVIGKLGPKFYARTRMAPSFWRPTARRFVTAGIRAARRAPCPSRGFEGGCRVSRQPEPDTRNRRSPGLPQRLKLLDVIFEAGFQIVRRLPTQEFLAFVITMGCLEERGLVPGMISTWSFGNSFSAVPTRSSNVTMTPVPMFNVVGADNPTVAALSRARPRSL